MTTIEPSLLCEHQRYKPNLVVLRSRFALPEWYGCCHKPVSAVRTFTQLQFYLWLSIRPNGGNTLDTFKANAASANSGAVPSGVTGGTFVNQNSPTGTIASSTTVATGTSTSAVTSAAKTG